MWGDKFAALFDSLNNVLDSDVITRNRHNTYR